MEETREGESIGRERKGWDEGYDGGNKEMEYKFLSFIHCMY
jgi:hypothetical protein